MTFNKLDKLYNKISKCSLCNMNQNKIIIIMFLTYLYYINKQITINY